MGCVTQVSMLNQYSEAIRGNLTKILRLKIVALVTVEVHARDVISKLAKGGCCDVNAFDWLCQLRLYWEKVQDREMEDTYRIRRRCSCLFKCLCMCLGCGRLHHQTDQYTLSLWLRVPGQFWSSGHHPSHR